MKPSKCRRLPKKDFFEWERAGTTYYVSVTSVTEMMGANFVSADEKAYFHVKHKESRFTISVLGSVPIWVYDIQGTECCARFRRWDWAAGRSRWQGVP